MGVAGNGTGWGRWWKRVIVIKQRSKMTQIAEFTVDKYDVYIVTQWPIIYYMQDLDRHVLTVGVILGFHC